MAPTDLTHDSITATAAVLVAELEKTAATAAAAKAADVDSNLAIVLKTMTIN